MIVYVDIDETICIPNASAPDWDYSNAEPIQENIEKVNALYDGGHHVVYWTARGTASGKDWRPLTESQFEKWGVKCHELRFGKPLYDVFIDDKHLNNVWLKGLTKSQFVSFIENRTLEPGHHREQ